MFTKWVLANVQRSCFVAVLSSIAHCDVIMFKGRASIWRTIRNISYHLSCRMWLLWFFIVVNLFELFAIVIQIHCGEIYNNVQFAATVKWKICLFLVLWKLFAYAKNISCSLIIWLVQVFYCWYNKTTCYILFLKLTICHYHIINKFLNFEVWVLEVVFIVCI